MKIADNYFKHIIKLAIFVLFGIAFFKSLLASFTHDEAYTYLHYVTTSFKEIISYSHTTANNHMLNSLLTKVSYHLIGQSELALRLPNTFAFLIFLIIFYNWIFSLTPRKNLILIAFVLMFLNNQLFEFFSLSRGYGLSFLFSFLAIKALIEPTIYSSTKGVSKMYFWLILMVLSNFSTLIIYVAVSGVFLILNLMSNRKWWWRNLCVAFISSSTLAIIIYVAITRLIEEKQFYFGGTTSFYTDTFHSIYQGFLSGVTLPPFVPQFIFGLIILLGLSTIFISKSREVKLTQSKSFISFLVLVSTVITNLLLHYIIGSKFLIHRTALIYYGLTMIFIITYLIDISNNKPFPKWINLSLLTFSFILIFHFSTTFDFWKYRDWYYDTDTKDLAYGLNQFGKNNNKRLEIGAMFIYEPSFNYYIKSRNLEWLQPLTRDPLKTNSDFYYLLEVDTLNFVYEEMNLLTNYKNSSSNLYINLEANNNDQSQINTSSIKLQTPSWDF